MAQARGIVWQVDGSRGRLLDCTKGAGFAIGHMQGGRRQGLVAGGRRFAIAGGGGLPLLLSGGFATRESDDAQVGDEETSDVGLRSGAGGAKRRCLESRGTVL